MTEQELREYYHQMREADFPQDMQFEFSSEIGESDAIEYHYELLCDIWKGKSYSVSNLTRNFQSHNFAGIDFLLQKAQQQSNEIIKIHTLYLAASVANSYSGSYNKQHKELYKEYCDKIIPRLVEQLSSANGEVLRKAAIALGWIGTQKQIPILINTMLTASDSLARAWSATAFMQMSFNRVKADKVKALTSKAFYTSIAGEQDLYSLGMMIYSVAELYGKKWISGIAVEELRAEQILKAQKSAMRFLEKIVEI